MKVLVVGGGGREHALVDAFSREPGAIEVIAAPGNPGIAMLARCVPVSATELHALAHVAEEEAVDLVVVGPEAPLASGLVDLLEQRRIPAFGPTAAAAVVETSKAATKAMMLASGIPTARAEVFRSTREAIV
jgi:phosphoribosylamine--glycine ligase